MVISKRMLSLIVGLCFFSFVALSQTVTNVAAQQSGSTLLISYSLLSDTPCEISFNFSTDGGTSWTKPMIGVSGDVGAGIVQGNHIIRWEVTEGLNQLISSSVKFKVEANSNKLFKTVQIFNQIWNAENLSIDRFRNGDIIPEARTSEEWRIAGENKQPVWCYYNNDPKNGEIYGKLYNWYAVNDPRGLAPVGFHMPTDAEWTVLTNYLGGEKVAGVKLKSLQGWANGGNGSNSSNFNSLPGGSRLLAGNFSGISKESYWWTFSESLADSGWARCLRFDKAKVVRSSRNFKGKGCYVRCVRD